MRVTVVRPGDLGPSEAALWAEYQQASQETRNPFLSLTFAQAVGRARANARVAVVEDGGMIAAFLPFELARWGMAVPIGFPMNELQGFIGPAAFDARAVVRAAGLRSWRFMHAPTGQEALAPHHYRGTVVPCPVINLADGYQAYFSRWRKSDTGKTAEKRRRRLEARFGGVSVDWHSSDPEHLRQLIAWKSSAYGGAHQVFSDPTVQAIVAELATDKSEDCRGVVSVLFAGERPAAIVLGLAAGASLSIWFSGYDPGLRRFSPGTIMWYRLAEEAERQGITRIDFGGGQDSYKFSLANDSYPVFGGAVWASRAEEYLRRIYRQLYYDRVNRRARAAPREQAPPRRAVS
jgi:CelD/BcsL family acetyltransferase involved in cellulose biosynthesis